MTITLLTGIPRSGTTLVCACLNTLPDCVALVEPMNVPRHGDVPRAVAEIVDYATTMHASILSSGFARSKTRDGLIADNIFEEGPGEGGLRRDRHEYRDVPIAKPLSSSFRLFIKHPSVFTALARDLIKVVSLFAVVRHPLAVLASWNSVEANFRLGRMPAAEAFAPDLRSELDRLHDPLARQIELIRWIFDVYAQLPRSQIVSYEAVVADPTVALAPMTQSTVPITHPTRIFDLRQRYPNVDLAKLARALLAIENDLVAFYPDLRESLRPYLTT